MTRLQFLVFMVFVFVADWIFQMFAPGMFWFAPAALIGSMVSMINKNNAGPVIIVVSFFVDLFSGIPFGWVTLDFVAILIVFVLLKRWIRVTNSPSLFIAVHAQFLLAMFAIVLFYPIGFLAIGHGVIYFLLQSLAPIIMVIIINLFADEIC